MVLDCSPAARKTRGRIVGIERGMIFGAKVPFDHTVGSETAHDTPSPWVIVSAPVLHNRLPIVQAVPLTSKLENETGFYKHRFRIPASAITKYDGGRLYATDQLALTEQVRVLAHNRLELPPCGKIPVAEMSKISAGLRYVLGILV